MPQRPERPEPREYYGLLEEITDSDPTNGYTRSFLLLDCVDAKRFRDSEANALADRSSLALVRAMSTPRRWSEWSGVDNLAKGDWLSLVLDDKGDAPRAWELEAIRNYAAGPVRSVRSIRRLGDGLSAPNGGEDERLALRLASASSWGRAGHQTVALDDFVSRLAGSGDEQIEIIALDVGQASATLIRRGGRSIGFFDAGAPIWFNKGSIILDFQPPVLVANGFVFLSHWDFDHFDLGRRHAPYRNLDWYAPDQLVGPNAAKFQSELGPRITFVEGSASGGGFTLARGTSTLARDRNGTGYQLRYEKNGSAVLLTGDTDYSCIESRMLAGLRGLSIPHHAGQGTRPPAPHASPRRAIASYGLPNSYRHPNGGTVSAHAKLGWDVLPTAAGVLPRGHRQLYP